jgi:hypothetical protein
MLRFFSASIVLCLLLSEFTWAQKPSGNSTPSTPAVPRLAEKTPTKSMPVATTFSPGELKATPEMWFYEQYMQQYQDPKMAVRANAEFRADQRQRRLAAMKWFGFSNSRPRACSDPYNGDQSPSWTGNNTLYPYRWSGTGQAWWYIARPERAGTYTY